MLRYFFHIALHLATHLALFPKDMASDILQLASLFEEDGDIDDEMLELATDADVWIKDFPCNFIYLTPLEMLDCAGSDAKALVLVEDATPAPMVNVEESPWQHFSDFFNAAEVPRPVHGLLASSFEAELSAGSGQSCLYFSPYQWFLVYIVIFFLIAATNLLLLLRRMLAVSPQLEAIVVPQHTRAIRQPIRNVALLLQDAQPEPRFFTPSNLNPVSDAGVDPLATPLSSAGPTPTTPLFASPEIAAASTPRCPPRHQLPRTAQVARHLLELGADQPRPYTPSNLNPVSDAGVYPPATPLSSAGPTPTTPLFPSPEIAAASTPRCPPRHQLPRTAQVARHLLELGAEHSTSEAELRVLEKWARVGVSVGSGPGLTVGVYQAISNQCAGEEKENYVPVECPPEGPEKIRMWRGKRWGA